MPFSIDSIINTLNHVEVKGKDNMDRLLGAILALEQIKATQEQNAPDLVTEIKEEGEVANG